MNIQKILLLVVLIALCTTSGCSRRSSGPPQKPFDGPPRIGNALKAKFPEQAAPILFLLRACKRNDVVLLERVGSRRMHRTLNRGTWLQQLEIYQSLFKQLLGPKWFINEFSYRYEGDEKAGLIIPKYGWSELPGLRVVLEGNSWKFDGR